MGIKKKSAKKIELEEDVPNSSITTISDDDDEEANKDLSLEIIQKSLLKRAINPQNGAVLDAQTVKKKKRKKKKKIDSEAVIVEEKEKEVVETIEAPEKVENAEVETGMVDTSDSVVLGNTASESHNEEIKTQKRKKKKKHESEIQTVNAVIVEEKEKEVVETIEAPEKVENAEVATGMVDTSDSVVLGNTASESHSEEIKTWKRKKKKKHESEIQTVNAVIVEEKEKEVVETIEAPEKVENAEVETGMVDTSDSVVLGNTASESHSEEIKTRKRKKKKKHESEIQTVNAVTVEDEEKEAVETIEDPEKVEPGEAAEPRVVNTSNNIVLRKLLRGPRYFDPPSDSVWGTCYNCGEEGHASFNCTAAKRKKPCFVCGSLSHNNGKKCIMGRYCSTCKLAGHRTSDCPKKHTGGSNSKSLTVCLRCGNSGHDMFLCKNDYSQDDLKEIQCYVCKKFGHLCCVDATEAIPKEFSCYRCGQMGHIGWACSRLKNEATAAATPSSCYKCGEQGHFARECSSSAKTSSRWQSETSGPATPSSCYRCGEEGHFSRECSSSVKVGNRKHNISSTETPRSQKENGHMGYRSAPHDNGYTSKMTRPHTEESDIKTPKKSKHRGDWTAEHSGEFSPSNSQRDNWRSPITPCTNYSTKNHFYNSGSHNLSTKSYMRNVHNGTPNSQGSTRTFHHGYSASRFGNSSSNGFERSYNNGW